MERWELLLPVIGTVTGSCGFVNQIHYLFTEDIAEIVWYQSIIDNNDINPGVLLVISISHCRQLLFKWSQKQ